MNVNDAINFIHSLERFGTKLGLETTAELLSRIGNPHKKLKFIHVAGTNGKGSTSSYIANILMAKGYKTGMYISPFVNKFNERIQINGQFISDEELSEYVEIIKNVIDDTCNPTEFEVVTAIGMLHFVKHSCDYVVLEVGLGGRFDATNVIPVPEVAVITSISIDHTDLLGDTVSKIAFEKAGIIKEKGTVVTYADNPRDADMVFEQTAKNKNCRLIKGDKRKINVVSKSIEQTTFDYKGERYAISMLGSHQIYNAVTAIETANVLGIEKPYIKEGLLNTSFGGRLEVISKKPLVLIDGAHNYSGVLALKDALTQYFSGKKITLVMGMLKDKEYEKCIKTLAPLANHFIATEPQNPRKLPAKELCTIAGKYTDNTEYYEDKNAAIKKALSYNNDVTCVCGSLYLIGNICID